jgi:hypothetical protein
MFGLVMVHRAILAGGPALQLHEALLGLLHRELFAAMTVAVSCATMLCCKLSVFGRLHIKLVAALFIRFGYGELFVRGLLRLKFLLCCLSTLNLTPVDTSAYRMCFDALQAQSASLGVVAGICQVLLAVWQVLGPCSMLQMEAVLQSVLLRLADGEHQHNDQSMIQLGSSTDSGCLVTVQGIC